MLVEKEVIRPGVYWYKDQDTGEPRKLVVTPELTKYWGDQGNAMLSSGLTVPVPCEHDFDAHPMTPADKLLNNAGWVKEYKRHDGTPQKGPGDRLFGVVDVQDADVAKKLPGTIRWTSPWINSFTDGKGKEWKNVISHLALTTRPRIVEQAPFGSVAAALSMATRGDTDTLKKGMCLSRAGLLADDGQPAYPMAFSAWSDGIVLNTEHDAAGRFTGPGGGGKELSGRAKMISELHGEVTVRAASATEKAHGLTNKSGWSMGKAARHSKRAVKAAESGDHDTARKAHATAAKELDKFPGAHEEASSHREASKAHAYAHHIKGIPMSVSLGGFPPKKGKGPPNAKKPSSQGGAPDDNPTSGEGKKPGAPPDIDGDGEEGDELDEDGDGETDEGNIDLEPFNDPAGDVKMEELLCDLLGALGINVEHTGGEDMFKRSLYNAAMTKIHELAGKGDANQQPNRTNPPGQPPNNPKPGAPGQTNPLIQQEQQPMYMSLDDINKITDPTMKNIAMSMYQENVKLRGEVEASSKTAKLQEANGKRAERVKWLGKISPKAKADLDAMLALPAMALSMGDGGEVVDPMATTLAVLEKGLSDMPAMLTAERTALSIHPQPTDGEMSAEEIDKLADDMARMMGCPPEQKQAG